MLQRQRTINHEVSLSGVGLHTGREAALTFRPAPENTGVRIRRVDVDNSPEIVADIDHVVDISRGTTLAQNGVKVMTVEHVLAAIAGLEIDNIYVDLDTMEPPVGDGSAEPFVKALLEAGFREQNAPKGYLEIERTIIYHDEGKGVDLVVTPSTEFKVTYMVDYKNPALGTQYTTMYSLQEEFVKEFASARTYGFLSEVESLKEQGLIKGGDLDNAIIIVDREIDEGEFDRLKKLFGFKKGVVLGDNGILDNRQLRFPNEPVRHKVLDLIGDLSLLGFPIKGHVLAARAGHAAHVELVKMIRKVYEKRQITKKYQTRISSDFVFDINAIQRILPHRPPFLLVDRIIDLVPGERVTGVKNVTINEPFFHGHFPEHPIMPGVLIVEAMGQTGGILLLNTVKDPEGKVVYFTGLDNVRFRKPVLPGDQLYFVVEMVKFRLGICKMTGKAYVADELVAEAEMTAAVVEKQ